jgi:hypothetical protein
MLALIDENGINSSMVRYARLALASCAYQWLINTTK